MPVNGPEYQAYEKEQRALIREIWDGQLPQRVGKIEIAEKNPLASSDVIAQDDNGNWYPVRQ